MPPAPFATRLERAAAVLGHQLRSRLGFRRRGRTRRLRKRRAGGSHRDGQRDQDREGEPETVHRAPSARAGRSILRASHLDGQVSADTSGTRRKMVSGTRYRAVGMLDFARTAPIDAAYLRHVVGHLSADRLEPARISRHRHARGSRRGRVRGRRDARRSGLADVALEPVPVDGWRLRDARVAVTGRSGVRVRLDGRRSAHREGRRARAARRRRHRRAAAARPPRRGAAGSRCSTGAAAAARPATSDSSSASGAPSGSILNCPEGGPFYQSPRALGSFSSHWYAGAPPFVTMCKEDAAELRDRPARGAARGAADAARAS